MPFLEELCCHGSLSLSRDTSEAATAVLGAALAAVMTEGEREIEWMREPLLQRVPFIEVHVCHVHACTCSMHTHTHTHTHTQASLVGSDGLFSVFCEFLESVSVSELDRLQSLIRMMFSTRQE